ncbi:hypothetical protein B0H14DRAFT_3550115 [Mycena olivaceomarginata]|nr:hypothetical protein B0H14DRAFT_3550115 [Mycena olivaceomarginata]
MIRTLSYLCQYRDRIKTDTTVWEDQLAAFQRAKNTFKRIDYVFANAGIAEHPWLPPFDPETATSRPLVKPDLATADINLTGQLYTAALALQTFERQEIGPSGFRGKLILTASVFCVLPLKGDAAVRCFQGRDYQFYALSGSILRNQEYHGQRRKLTVPVQTRQSLRMSYSSLSRERKLLSDMQLVLDQFQKFLGGSTINGQALSICQDNVWIHPADTHMFEENDPACELISVELFKLFGDNTL